MIVTKIPLLKESFETYKQFIDRAKEEVSSVIETENLSTAEKVLAVMAQQYHWDENELKLDGIDDVLMVIAAPDDVDCVAMIKIKTTSLKRGVK